MTMADPKPVESLSETEAADELQVLADEIAAQLARWPNMIVLSLPVDYWDYIGWKDTLALHGHSNRQRAAAACKMAWRRRASRVAARSALEVDVAPVVAFAT